MSILGSPKESITTIDYWELLQDEADKSSKIEEGFGSSGLGIITVSGVPELCKLRNRLLLLINKFAEFPEEVKQKYRDPKGGLSVVGWSRGIEILEDGKADSNKGSFYANPLHDVVTTDEELLRLYPSYTTPNIWPTEDLPELQLAFQELGRLIIKVGLLVVKACDLYVSERNPFFKSGSLTQILARSVNPKGRLLHYYPPGADEPSSRWCAQHTDHGSLTGLLSAMYTRGSEIVPNPDPASGLYIVNCKGVAVKASIPEDHIAFQMGEAMQVHSGGLLRATPHYVRTGTGAGAQGVARNTLAIFMQPRWDEPMDSPQGASSETVGIGQWCQGINFGEFSELTIKNNHAPE